MGSRDQEADVYVGELPRAPAGSGEPHLVPASQRDAQHADRCVRLDHVHVLGGPAAGADVVGDGGLRDPPARGPHQGAGALHRADRGRLPELHARPAVPPPGARHARHRRGQLHNALHRRRARRVWQSVGHAHRVRYRILVHHLFLEHLHRCDHGVVQRLGGGRAVAEPPADGRRVQVLLAPAPGLAGPAGVAARGLVRRRRRLRRRGRAAGLEHGPGEAGQVPRRLAVRLHELHAGFGLRADGL
mmetsp:Transcript_5294/g.15783  ORF Transcript_5294/g.15783 Transcript_5294/m.15783 type:complete len:245 (+) Transcript_5294:409-1143(+)